MIQITAARLEDVPYMREVGIATYRATFDAHNTPGNMKAYLEEAYNLETLRQEWSEPRSKIFLAWENSNQVGFARVRENNEVESYLGKNALELQRLYVLKEMQGKQVGKLLMDAALDYAASEHYEWIWLGVWERNYKAQRFYDNLGFQKFSEHTFQMGDDPQIDWLLKRRI